MRITRFRLIRWTAAVLLMAYMPACTSYHVLADPVTALRASPKPIDRARVTLLNGQRFEMKKVQVEGDSLRGFGYGVGERGIALSDIKQVEVAKANPGKTVALVLGIGALVGVVAAVAVSMSDWGSSCTFEPEGGYY